jgi:triacylglycerol lipase
MKSTPNPPCPVPSWAFFLALLIGEIAFLAWFTRYGVANGWWSDLVGGLLFIALPLLLRFLILWGFIYRLSRKKAMPLLPEQMLRGAAWWKFFLVEYVHFCKQSFLHLPFPVFFRTASDRGSGAATGEVILLQHGYIHNGAVWFPTARALEKLGYRVFTIDQPLYAPIDTMADRLAARIHDIQAKTGVARLTIVAHSMGGLISRAYLRKYGSSRVRQLITLGSPHNGTYHAYLAQGTNGRQMRPGNTWLAELGRTKVNVPFTSIYSIYDTMITPQDSSRLPEANNVEITGMGHVTMLGGKEMRTHILRALGLPIR